MLARLLIEVSEHLLQGGRDVAQAAPDPAARLAGLVAFHTEFALQEPDVIRVQDRDLLSLEPAAADRVRHLQRDYVRVWVRTLRELDEALTIERARTRAHATFGLLNSTPHSARARGTARDELVAMALRALDAPLLHDLPVMTERPAGRSAAPEPASRRSAPRAQLH